MLTVNKIIADVEDYYQLPAGVIFEKERLKTTARARKLAMYLARTYTRHSWNELADVFHRNHSTLIKVLRNVDDIQEDINYFEKMYKQKNRLLSFLWRYPTTYL